MSHSNPLFGVLVMSKYWPHLHHPERAAGPYLVVPTTSYHGTNRHALRRTTNRSIGTAILSTVIMCMS